MELPEPEHPTPWGFEPLHVWERVEEPSAVGP